MTLSPLGPQRREPDPVRRLHAVDPADASPSTTRQVLHDVERAPSLAETTLRLRALKAEVVRGDEVATRAQHGRGRLTARERLELLLDPGTFHEIEGLRRHRSTDFGMGARRPHTDGVVTGWGTVYGRRVFVYASDFRVFGGSLGEAHAQKVHKLLDLALAVRAPVVSLNDGAGARIQEGVTALAGYGGIFRRTVAASGVVPQVSVMLGPCAGGAAYAPALTDFVFAVRDISQMFVTGPDVVSAVTGEQVTAEALGGADAHATGSGVAAFVHDDEQACLDDVRYLLALLPDNNEEPPPQMQPEEPLATDLTAVVPGDPHLGYDVLDVVRAVVDAGELIEVHERWARNVVCAFARIDGHTVGIVANQPAHLAGVLDVAAAEKAARFVTQCDSFNIPLVTLVDVPGFLPGVDQERDGIIRHGAKLIYAYCNARVPRVQVILRKAFGGAYIVMDSLSIGADLSYAWPGNEVAVMGAEAAANVIFRREIAVADDPEAVRRERVAEYADTLMHPLYAAERGLVDDVIEPNETRAVLVEALAVLRSRRATAPTPRHGNPPL